ncbi:MAG: hypothetical protein ACTSQ4_02240 [Candidatus Heimdallarchaeaceae archaeon]
MKKDLNKLSFQELQNEVATLEKKKEGMNKVNLKDSPLVIGESYLIRTVTMIYTGKLTKVYDKELVVIDAAWIPDTGRWQQAVENGIFDEVEPYPDNSEVILGRDAILDITKVYWKLPRNQK